MTQRAQSGAREEAGLAHRLVLLILAAVLLLGGCLETAEDKCFTFNNPDDSNASTACKAGDTTATDSTGGSVAIVHLSTVNEVVVLANTGLIDEDLTGWTLINEVSNDAADTFTFPSFILGEGDFVRVHSITGTDDADDLYWDGGNHWDTLDSIALKDELNNTIDTCGDGDTCWDKGD